MAFCPPPASTKNPACGHCGSAVFGSPFCAVSRDFPCADTSVRRSEPISLNSSVTPHPKPKRAEAGQLEAWFGACQRGFCRRCSAQHKGGPSVRLGQLRCTCQHMAQTRADIGNHRFDQIPRSMGQSEQQARLAGMPGQAGHPTEQLGAAGDRLQPGLRVGQATYQLHQL